jgi:hypothetical protein
MANIPSWKGWAAPMSGALPGSQFTIDGMVGIPENSPIFRRNAFDTAGLNTGDPLPSHIDVFIPKVSNPVNSKTQAPFNFAGLGIVGVIIGAIVLWLIFKGKR